MTFDPSRIIAGESARFAEVLSAIDGGRPVPSCPGWSADDLLWHLTEVQAFWSLVLSSGVTTDEQVEAIQSALPVRPGDRRSVLAMRARATEDLLAALASGPLDAPAWSWFPPDQSVRFTQRMQVHEATIHRADAELTAGLPVSAIDSGVAAAGIDHVLDVMWNWVPASAATTPLGVVLLAPTDAAPRAVELYRWSGETWGRSFTDQVGARRASDAAAATAVVRGSAMQLDLLVWSRPGEVTATGDAEVLSAFDEMIAAGIQ